MRNASVASMQISHDFSDYFNMESVELNTTDNSDVVVPSPEKFVVGVYGVLLVVGALGNVTVFVSLLRSRRRKSRVNLLMTHLVVADMIVTFIVIPLEIGWRTTNAWLAGNLACKFFLVLRAFGLYLSSNVLVCISVDRSESDYKNRSAAAACFDSESESSSDPEEYPSPPKKTNKASKAKVVKKEKSSKKSGTDSSRRKRNNVGDLGAESESESSSGEEDLRSSKKAKVCNSKAKGTKKEKPQKKSRFFAILYPLRLAVARKRSKMMLYMAWIVALLCSLPQSAVFRVMTHPTVEEFEQCVSFETFTSQHQELAYNVFCLCAMYFLPLMVITVCYACIFYEISKNSKESSEKCQQSDHSRVMLRRSDQRPLARARRRTLRMTVTIVTVFACCWLPYATMTLWYMLDRQSAQHFSARVQDLFFIMAVSNSCMDPLVYGTYTLDPLTLTRTVRKIFCIHDRPSVIPGITGPDLLKSKQQSNDCHPDHVRANYTRRCPVRFEDISIVRPSANSDPIHFLSEPSFAERTVKPSQSCEVFVLHTPHRSFRS